MANDSRGWSIYTCIYSYGRHLFRSPLCAPLVGRKRPTRPAPTESMDRPTLFGTQARRSAAVLGAQERRLRRPPAAGRARNCRPRRTIHVERTNGSRLVCKAGVRVLWVHDFQLWEHAGSGTSGWYPRILAQHLPKIRACWKLPVSCACGQSQRRKGPETVRYFRHGIVLRLSRGASVGDITACG